MKQELRIDRNIDLNQFVQVIQGETRQEYNSNAKGVCVDTRVIKQGDLFFAIKGTRDGHEFVKQAIEDGAAACVVDHDMNIPNQIIVPDTLSALWNYANWVRTQWGKTVIALSGSNGKTSTKEMMATLLGEKTLKTPGTWNNFLGVPLTLLLLETHHDYAVVEMGINHFGELTHLCRIANPNIAILTNIGPAHLMEFGDLDGVARAKGEIFSQLKGSDIAVLNIDDPRIEAMKSSITVKTMTVSQKQNANVQVVSKARLAKGYDLKIMYGKTEINVKLPVSGEHNISNYLCSLGIASAVGMSPEKIIQRTAQIAQVQMRMEELNLSGQRKIINDCYNANLGSFKAAVQTVLESSPKRFLVLMGDILEMGAQAVQIHRDLGKLMADSKVTHVFVVGDHAKDVIDGATQAGLPKEVITHIQERSQAAQKILPYFQPEDILLVKGSRGMKLEEIISDLEQELEG
ncbi:MAG: UDP-N-acetylmuramoyl-tripeptide--D-alanyl-D-alanine ligase [Bdellovibrionota bacterium]